MKEKIIFTTIFCFLVFNQNFAQETGKKVEPNGKATGIVFSNYHYDLTKNSEKKSQFEILRAYLGYLYNFSDKFHSKIVLDVSNDGKAFSAFLKAASLEWKINDRFFLEGGMIGTLAFDTQEKFYGQRYIMEAFMDKNKFYSSADLGIKATFKPIDIVELHAGVFNGEGYKKIQDDFGVHRTSFDVVIKPVKGLLFKAYYDIMPKRDTAITNEDLLHPQSVFSLFLCYEVLNSFRAGIEYDRQNNSDNKEGYALDGISVSTAYTLKKIELFARYDQVASNTLEGTTNPWNLTKDYSMILGGIQYAPQSGIKLALNYRHFLPRMSGTLPLDLIYLNLEFKF